jgi:hypothetical protein
MILQRSFIDAILDSQSRGVISIFVFLVIVIASVLILRFRFPIPKKILLSAIGLAVAIPLIIPYLFTQILVLVVSVVAFIGGTILYTGLSSKLSGSREQLLNATQTISVILLVWASLSLVLGIGNMAIAFAQGAQSIPTQLINKFEYPKKNRVLLMFSASQAVSQSGFMDVWLPISNSQAFTEENCYQVEYFKSPFLVIEGRSEVYVTRIQAQECK